MTRRFALTILIVAGAMAPPAQAGALWARTYADALKAASDTGRPLLVVFSVKETVKTDKKMIDDSELAPLHPYFICFQEVMTIDKKNNTVSSALFAKYRPEKSIKFPLIFLADESEKTLHKTDGPQSAQSLALAMKAALLKHGPVADPRKAGEAAAMVKRADALLEKQQFSAAAHLYQEAIATNLKTLPVLAAKDKLAKIEDAANKEMAAARSDINDKAYPEALDKLFQVDRKYSSVKAGQEAHAELAKLRELPEAKAAYAAAEKRAASRGAETVVATLTPSGPPLDPFTEEDLVALDEMDAPQTARTTAAATAADPVEECRRLFGSAQDLIDNKQPDKAKPILRKIVEQYPKTIYADQAKTLLEELSK